MTKEEEQMVKDGKSKVWEAISKIPHTDFSREALCEWMLVLARSILLSRIEKQQ